MKKKERSMNFWMMVVIIIIGVLFFMTVFLNRDIQEVKCLFGLSDCRERPITYEYIHASDWDVECSEYEIVETKKIIRENYDRFCVLEKCDDWYNKCNKEKCDYILDEANPYKMYDYEKCKMENCKEEYKQCHEFANSWVDEEIRIYYIEKLEGSGCYQPPRVKSENQTFCVKEILVRNLK